LLAAQLNPPTTTNQNLIDLHKILHEKLYLENIQSCNTKEELQYYIYPKDKNIALHDKFIRYGNKTATSFIIIDIDNVKAGINRYYKEVIHKLGIEPNWITRTNKGYHIGFILEKPLYLNNDINQNKAIEIKKNLTNILNADIAGSHRLIGYWRNPLVHESIIFTDKLFSIDELHKASFNQYINSNKEVYNQKFRNSEIQNSGKSENQNMRKAETIKLNIENIDKQGFIEGNRNNYLFTKVIGMLYNEIITNDEVENTLKNLNNNELPEQEVQRICKSIIKYDIKPNNPNKEEYKPGEYHNDLWDNKIHNYKKKNKVEFSRQKIGQKITTAKIIENTISKLVQGYKVTYRNNELFTNENIVKNSNVSKSTIKRYRNVRKLEQEIKNRAFKIYLSELIEQKSVMANEPPISEIVNLALSELVFEYKRTNKTFAFKIDDNKRLIFYEIQPNYEDIAA